MTTEDRHLSEMAEQEQVDQQAEAQDAETREQIGGLVDALYGGEEAPEASDDEPEPEEVQASEGDTEADEDGAEESDADATEEESTDEPEAGIADDDFQTLKRAGFSEERIKKMSPELAAEFAEDARDAKRANDREYQEYLAQKRKADTDETERPEAGDQPHPSEPNLPDLAALSQPFAEDLGVEPERLTEFSKAIIEAASGPLRQQVTDLLSRNDSQTAILEEALVDAAVSRLSGDFPQLRSSEKLSSIVEKTRNVLIANPSKKGSVIDRIESAMRDVSSVEFKDEIVKRELDRKDKQRQRGRQRANGQPTSATRRGGSPTDPEAAFRSTAAKLLDDAGL